MLTLLIKGNLPVEQIYRDPMSKKLDIAFFFHYHGASENLKMWAVGYFALYFA